MENGLAKVLSVMGSILTSLGVSVYGKLYDGINDGVFAYVNDHMAKNSNHSTEELLGKTDYHIRSQAEAERIEADDRQILKTKQPILDKAEKLTRPDGQTVWVLAFKFPWYENGILRGVAGVSVNITNRKHVEGMILNMGISSLHDVVNKLLPLNIEISNLIEGKHGTISDPQALEKLEQIKEQLLRTHVIASDHLNKARFMDGENFIRKGKCDLRREIINPILHELQFEIENKKINIDTSLGFIPEGRVILADRHNLMTVFRNLITNAIKHNNVGTSISLGYEEHAAYWRINVYDNGISIPAHLIKYLFKKSSGLGLYSIKKIIDSHGGQIWYDIPRSGGNNFIIQLPKF